MRAHMGDDFPLLASPAPHVGQVSPVPRASPGGEANSGAWNRTLSWKRLLVNSPPAWAASPDKYMGRMGVEGSPGEGSWPSWRSAPPFPAPSLGPGPGPNPPRLPPNLRQEGEGKFSQDEEDEISRFLSHDDTLSTAWTPFSALNTSGAADHSTLLQTSSPAGPSSPGVAADTQTNPTIELGEVALRTCSCCGRRFRESRLPVHEEICYRNAGTGKKRSVFESSRQRCSAVSGRWWSTPERKSNAGSQSRQGQNSRACSPQDPAANVVPGETAKPRLNRSVSGFAEVEVQHLPPVQLQLKLPAGYPSSEPPDFRLSCSWMDLDSLSAFCRSLDDQWEQAKGSAIIYTWVDVLRQEVLELILKNRGALAGKVFLTLKAIDGLPTSDPRAESNCTDPVQTLLDLLMYDKGKRLDIWSQQQHVCNVCFCEHPGSHFVHLGGCSHAFCKTCVKTMAEIHVNEGSIADLVCPETGCRAEIAPSALMQVLDEPGYERWQTLKLRRALTTANLVLCPRCEEMGMETPVLPDPVSDSDQLASLPPVARCGRCEYVFCATCLSLYHGTEPCLAPEERAQQVAMRRLGTATSVAEKRKLKREAQKGYLVCIDVGEDMLPIDAAGHTTEDCEPNVAEGDKVIAVHTGVPDKITGRALWDAKFDNICNLATVLMESPRPISIRLVRTRADAAMERHRQRRLMEELLTLREIAKESQPCPVCKERQPGFVDHELQRLRAEFGEQRQSPTFQRRAGGAAALVSPVWNGSFKEKRPIFLLKLYTMSSLFLIDPPTPAALLVQVPGVGVNVEKWITGAAHQYVEIQGVAASVQLATHRKDVGFIVEDREDCAMNTSHHNHAISADAQKVAPDCLGSLSEHSMDYARHDPFSDVFLTHWLGFLVVTTVWALPALKQRLNILQRGLPSARGLRFTSSSPVAPDVSATTEPAQCGLGSEGRPQRAWGAVPAMPDLEGFQSSEQATGTVFRARRSFAETDKQEALGNSGAAGDAPFGLLGSIIEDVAQLSAQVEKLLSRRKDVLKGTGHRYYARASSDVRDAALELSRSDSSVAEGDAVAHSRASTAAGASASGGA
ncbi:RNF14 [Symbiodinium sp. KB8]|nr:RNF14 [Symbiodinium sp. KB8]